MGSARAAAPSVRSFVSEPCLWVAGAQVRAFPAQSGVADLRAAGSATTGSFIGEFCWRKSPFIDVVKLSVSQGGSQLEVHGSQAVPPPSYTLPIAGNAFTVGSTVILGVLLVGDRTSFGGSRALVAYVPLDLSTLSGSGTLVSIDPAGFGPSPSTWIPISCPAGPANVSDVGEAEGAQEK